MMWKLFSDSTFITTKHVVLCLHNLSGFVWDKVRKRTCTVRNCVQCFVTLNPLHFAVLNIFRWFVGGVQTVIERYCSFGQLAQSVDYRFNDLITELDKFGVTCYVQFFRQSVFFNSWSDFGVATVRFIVAVMAACGLHTYFFEVFSYSFFLWIIHHKSVSVFWTTPITDYQKRRIHNFRLSLDLRFWETVPDIGTSNCFCVWSVLKQRKSTAYRRKVPWVMWLMQLTAFFVFN